MKNYPTKFRFLQQPQLLQLQITKNHNKNMFVLTNKIKMSLKSSRSDPSQ